MAFRDLIRKQRQAGAGIIPAVGGAAGATIREALDIRNLLFTKGSVLGALFPNIKGFKADVAAPKTRKSPTSLLSAGASSSALSDAKLDIISQNTKISAKNSMILPFMARDMNVMRQNIVKLVKISGGKASTKADAFFMKKAERERAYEAEMQEKKDFPTRAEPTEETGDRRTSGGGFLGALGSIFGVGGRGVAGRGRAGAGLGALAGLFTGLMLAMTKLIAKVVLVGTAVALLFSVIKKFVGWFEDTWPKFKKRFDETWLGKKLKGEDTTQQSLEELQARDTLADAILQIEDLNPNIEDPFNLPSGQQVKLPNNTIAIADQGDTIDSIAYKYVRGDYNEGREENLDKPEGLGTPRVRGKIEDAFDATTDTTPTRVTTTEGPLTFNQLSKGQQDTLLDIQFKREGNRPGNLAYDLNNPGAMLWSPRAAKFGAEIDPNRGSGDLKGKFARFPTFELGREAQRDLWSRKYGDLPLEQAISKWTTGKMQGDGSIELSNYKSAILDALETRSSAPVIAATTPVESTTRVPGNQIAAASAETDLGRMAVSSPPPVVSVTSPDATPRTPSIPAQQVSIPTTIDADLFDALVMRVTEYS